MNDNMKWKERLDKGRGALGSLIVGNDEVIRLGLIALLCNKHLLLTTIPGYGKTTLGKAFQKLIVGATSGRIQFTPDLLPGDLIGRREFDEATQSYTTVWNEELFKNVVLGDEVNRAMEKTQSALLQSLEEGAATIRGITRKLPEPHLVLATRNPVEQKGTFQLPEAFLDRFILECIMKYPDKREMIALLRNVSIHRGEANMDGLFTMDEITTMQHRVDEMVADAPDAVLNYVDDLMRHTQVFLPEFGTLKVTPTPNNPNELARLKSVAGKSFRELEVLEHGVSPRGSIWQVHVACANALLEGQDAARIEDVRATFIPANRHRLILSRNAKIEQIHSYDILRAALQQVKF